MTRRYTVRALTAELTRLLEGRYPLLEVEGEVGEIKTPSSGHAYLRLRDGDASLGAVAWRNTWRTLRYRPKVGQRVVCRGRLSVYPVQGSYQLYINQISPAGEGKMAAELARRRARLQAEGLLDPRRKRSLPPMPRIVGVATSPTGAALADFLKVSRQRFPAAKILLSPCTVQGAHAAGSVVAAVDLLLEDGRAEVIVLTRGGGSAQDLLAFQDEHLARYVANCPVPTVSAVGHEVDTTLCDLVADRVAPTPSAAAMAVLPDARVLAQRVDEAMTTLDAHLRRGLRRRRERLVHLRKRLRHPGERLAEVRRRLVTAQTRLETAMAAQVRRRRERLAALTPRLDGFARSLPARRARVDALQTRLHTAMARQLEQRRARVTGALQRAEALSPAGVLQRGYALVTGPQGLVDRVDRATTGDALTVRVSDGQLTVRVESTSAG